MVYIASLLAIRDQSYSIMINIPVPDIVPIAMGLSVECNYVVLVFMHGSQRIMVDNHPIPEGRAQGWGMVIYHNSHG